MMKEKLIQKAVYTVCGKFLASIFSPNHGQSWQWVRSLHCRGTSYFSQVLVDSPLVAAHDFESFSAQAVSHRWHSAESGVWLFHGISKEKLFLHWVLLPIIDAVIMTHFRRWILKRAKCCVMINSPDCPAFPSLSCGKQLESSLVCDQSAWNN